MTGKAPRITFPIRTRGPMGPGENARSRDLIGSGDHLRMIVLNKHVLGCLMNLVTKSNRAVGLFGALVCTLGASAWAEECKITPLASFPMYNDTAGTVVAAARINGKLDTKLELDTGSFVS